jgi:plastocyanin
MSERNRRSSTDDAESDQGARPYSQSTMRWAALLVVLGLAIAGCGGDDEGENGGSAGGTPLKTITISETEYKLDPSSVSVDKAGTYAFDVVNDGKVAHALEIEGNGIEEETDTLEPGERATLTVELDGGSFELYCPVGDHADRGMKGELEVAGGSKDSGDGY